MDAAAVLDARQRLDGPVAAAAAAVLGPQAAGPWLVGQWRILARRAEAIAWHPARAEAHAAGLYLRAHAWAEAAGAVEGIPSWRRIPQPLLWMTQARWHSRGADAAWPLLAEALWLSPQRAATLLPALPDMQLHRIVDRFEACMDITMAEAPAPGDHRAEETGGTSDWAWLPAFALLAQPSLASTLSAANPTPDTPAVQAFQTVAALLRLERQGRHHEIVAHRARLQALSAPLMAAYMATR